MFIIFVFFAFIGIGCGGSDYDKNEINNPDPSAINITGEWNITITTTYDNVDPLTTKNKKITIEQVENNIWFTMQLSDPPVDMPFSGQISGSSITFSSTTETFTGTISADCNSMTGNFSGENGNSLWGGNWSAIKKFFLHQI